MIFKTQHILLDLPRWAKRFLVVLLDALACCLASWAAMCLRFESVVPFGSDVYVAALMSLLLALPIFVTMGLYRAIFRYSGWNALVALGKAMLCYSVLHGLVLVWVGSLPRSLIVLQPILLLVVVALSRFAARMWLDASYKKTRVNVARPRVLIYGAGSAGRQLAAAMMRSDQHRLVGYIDDDARLHGHTLDTLRVYGVQDMQTCLEETRASEVLLAIPSASRARRAEVLELLRHYPLHVRSLPGLADLASGNVGLSDVKELEIDDLLGRESVAPNLTLLNMHTAGKVVLVTGAGGSIGSELCRQIIKCRPKTLLLVELSEFALYQIHQELQSSDCEVIPLLASVCHESRMNDIMAVWRPHAVYHAAAYKHVPLVEHNPTQGLLNNVWGTQVCALAALAHGVQRFVLVSTDKAVRPTNIMGASKRLAEMVLQALAQAHAGADICFSMVRFGNVLGSSGSVVPLFREQIKTGVPITLTHADINRYFMTIPEAAQLVIQAGAMGEGGDVFVLDMGEPVRIYDLACRMVELSGLTLRTEANPSGDVEISITGLRPGEKLYEELLIGDNPEPTQHPRIMKAHEKFLSLDAIQIELQNLMQAIEKNDVHAIRNILQSNVQGYQPSDEIVDWIYLGSNTKAQP